MTEPQDGCVQGAAGPIDSSPQADAPLSAQQPVQEVKKMTARVGRPAPDFEASAYFEGGFKNIKLSDYKGQWVVLCFYPGDFTFV